MAVDQALMQAVQRGGAPVLRLYAWQPACLSFGRNQHTRGVYDADAVRAAGVDTVRRPTGGLAVLHDREVTYAVAAPADLLGGPRQAYVQINRALVAGLQRLGVPASVAGAAPAPHPLHDSAAPCFQSPAPGEVVAAGRKLVGSAQRCERRVILQHGSILMDGSQSDVKGFLLAGAGPESGPGSITLRELLGSAPAPLAVADAVGQGFQDCLGIPLAPSALSAEEQAEADRLEAVYEGADWTWRR